MSASANKPIVDLFIANFGKIRLELDPEKAVLVEPEEKA